MAVFMPRSGHLPSPTTTQMLDGYTDDALASRYDNHRSSRPLSQLSGTSLGSRIRLSTFSIADLDDTMLTNPSRRISQLPLEHRQHHHHVAANQPPPTTFFGKVKFYYNKYNGRHFAPSVLLFIYSLLGAWMFYAVEHEYEKELLLTERIALDNLRNGTISMMSAILTSGRGRENNLLKAGDLLLSFESELRRVKLPEALPWDMWGALFYVGTVFTTIGYGNIVPRTTTGRLLSVLYAIIGIPLVLAMLSHFGGMMTRGVGVWWQNYGKYFRRRKNPKPDVEKGKADDEVEDEESRTIPVLLALIICMAYICACAGLFLIWEKRWTFFTSLYFFFISLSTIGLGDVVPDKPHMLILMFWLVIIGLSIVSMLLSVIQIKMEEWLRTLILKMKREYERRIEQGEDIGEGELMNVVLEKQGFLSKYIVPNLISEKQAEAVEHKAEQLERLVREQNNKNMQTERLQCQAMGTQAAANNNSMACDPMTSSVNQTNQQQTQWSTQQPSSHSVHSLIPLREISVDDRDSISDATSLPMDSVSVNGRKLSDKVKKVQFCAECADRGERQRDDKRAHTSDDERSLEKTPRETFDELVQTDIAQFQLDEIVLRLAALQTQRVRPPLVERGMATSMLLSNSIDDAPKPETRQFTDAEILTEVLGVMSRSMETDGSFRGIHVDHGMNTSTNGVASRGTDPQRVYTMNRSVGDDVILKSSAWSDDEHLTDKSIQTSRRSPVDRSMATSECSRRDDVTMTSPAVSITEPAATKKLRLAEKTVETSISEDIDRSIQTSLMTSPPSSTDRMTSPMTSQTSDKMTSPMESMTHDRMTSPMTLAQTTDRMTSPEIRLLVGKTMGTSRLSRENTMTSSDDGDVIGGNDVIAGNDVIGGNDVICGNDVSQQTRICGIDTRLRRGRSSGERSGEDSGGSDVACGDSVRMTDSFDSRLSRSGMLRAQDSQDSHAHLGIKNRARSSSTSGMGTSICDDDLRQEVIIQTDDSYLKIARRLDEYRNNRTQFLPVCAAAPLGSKEVQPFSTDRPSERRGFFVDHGGNSRTRSFNRSKRRNLRNSHAEAQTGVSMDQEQLNNLLNTCDGKSRSVSPRPHRLLERTPSLPNGVSRGKVGEFVAKHERGIPNPATERRRPVQIIRQYSMEDKGN